jgi:polyisoprenoid-binding protein YceI
MTNYIVASIAAVSMFAVACSAADGPAAPAAAKPAANPVTPASEAAAATALPRYVQAPAGSSLTFTFVQEGAANQGSFRKFTTELAYDENAPANCSLDVKVQIASVDTEDKDRNEMLAGADLFDAQKFPTAHYLAHACTKAAGGGLSAMGKLTLRGVTRDLTLPLKISRSAAGLDLSGEATIKRLDFGVGQGDWKSTESVANEVKVQYKVALVKAK